MYIVVETCIYICVCVHKRIYWDEKMEDMGEGEKKKEKGKEKGVEGEGKGGSYRYKSTILTVK